MSESFVFYNVTWHKARVTHHCCECGLQIDKGEVYQRLSGFLDKWHTYKTCEPCAEVRSLYCPEFTLTQLAENLMDLRDALPYDNVRMWSLLTNEIAGLRTRAKAARTYKGIPALTPLPPRGATGSLAPALAVI